MNKHLHHVIASFIVLSFGIWTLGNKNWDIQCFIFPGSGYIRNEFQNGPVFSENELLRTEFRTTQSHAPIIFAGCNETYYYLAIVDGLLEFSVRLPANLPRSEGDIDDSGGNGNSSNHEDFLGPSFKWHRSSRAGSLTLHDILQPVPHFNARLDDFQRHEVILERSVDTMRLTVDSNLVLYQRLQFDGIRAGLLQIQEIHLGGKPFWPGESTDLSWTQMPGIHFFEGDFGTASLQVDDIQLNMLQFASQNLHGFTFTNGKLETIDCYHSSATLQSNTEISFNSPSYLHLRFPLIAKLRWQELEIDITSPRSASNQLLLTLYDSWPTSYNEAPSCILAIELRQQQLWLVLRMPSGASQSVHIQGGGVETLKIKIGISFLDNGLIIAMQTATTLPSYILVGNNSTEVEWKDVETISALLRESQSRPMKGKTWFGRNLLLGGTNWTAETGFGRLPPQLWSGLGQRNAFLGCIHRLLLNGMPVNFGPILKSLMRNGHLHNDIRLGCNHETFCQVRDCKNGGNCDQWNNNRHCNCFETAFRGAFCQIPAKTLDFKENDVIRMRLPIVHRLESTEVEFAFRTVKLNTTIVSTQPLGAFSSMHRFYSINSLSSRITNQPIETLRIELLNGLLQVTIRLSSVPSVITLPVELSDNKWHFLRLLRIKSQLRIQLDGVNYTRELYRQTLEVGEILPTVIEIVIGGNSFRQKPLTAIEANTYIMRIHEIEVGTTKEPSPNSGFVGQIRHFKFNGLRLLDRDALFLIHEASQDMLKSTGISPAVNPSTVVTFKTAECYLRLPRLQLYDAFRLDLALKTHQPDGLLMFNSGEAKLGGDFLAVELFQGGLAISLDMGHGAALQARRVGNINYLSDGNWHRISISRRSETDDKLWISIFSEYEEIEMNDEGVELTFNISIPFGQKARNFNFVEPLYIGGMPTEDRSHWRKKLLSKHGIQGCIGHLSINRQPELDLFHLADSKYAMNRTSQVCQWQIMKGCVERPAGALSCPRPLMSTTEANAYCLNDGICLHVWSSLRCSCEMTTFTGKRCHLPGTSLRFRESQPYEMGTASYVQFTYLYAQQHTNRDEIALGLQTDFSHLEVDSINEPSHCSLLYVDAGSTNMDFLHVFLDNGRANLVFNMGGGPVRMVEQRRRLDDGKFHRIRIFRSTSSILFEVDELQTKRISSKLEGEQFNGQQSIWLGYAPNSNVSDAFRGVLTGVFFNGLPLNDLAAGLSHRADIHVSRHSDVHYVANFKVRLDDNSPLQQLSSEEHDELENVTEVNHDESIIGTNGENISNFITHQFPEQRTTSDTLVPTDKSPFQSKKTDLEIRSPVNLWLVVSLSAAGLILIGSITCILYRCLGGDSSSGSVYIETQSNKKQMSSVQHAPSEQCSLPAVPQPEHQRTVTFIAFQAPVASLCDQNNKNAIPFMTDSPSNAILMQNIHPLHLQHSSDDLQPQHI